MTKHCEVMTKLAGNSSLLKDSEYSLKNLHLAMKSVLPVTWNVGKI